MHGCGAKNGQATCSHSSKENSLLPAAISYQYLLSKGWSLVSPSPMVLEYWLVFSYAGLGQVTIAAVSSWMPHPCHAQKIASYSTPSILWLLHPAPISTMLCEPWWVSLGFLRRYRGHVVRLSLDHQLPSNDTKTSYEVWQLGLSLGLFATSSHNLN